MHIVQITPGAGGMYCGLCIRDNVLVGALRKLGHSVLMVPLYLPFTLDEPDQSAGTPIFFSGINVYLDQKSPLFRRAPGWLRRLFTSRRILKWAGKKAGNTRPQDLGELTLSMLRGEQGNQARELDQLITWLNTQPQTDLICLSSALLVGMADRLKSGLHAPVVCMFQGEDVFLDSLPAGQRADCWKELSQRAKRIDLLAAPSRYFGDLMEKRLDLSPNSVQTVPNGINLEGYASSPGDSHLPVTPTLGFFARMCPDKGLDLLIDAFIELRRRDRVKGLKLLVGGSCGPGDQPFVDGLRDRLKRSGFAADVEFRPNLDRADKIAFLKSLSVFSVPARYAEAFGLYVIEALATGVPVVQPASGAFPELVTKSGGGVLFEPGNPQAYVDALEQLLMDSSRAKQLGAAGRNSVLEKFSADSMARAMADLYSAAAHS
jgi:glycosyltransferase involved in cell wall biosynthesis